jgi:hypothetical protein
MADESTGRAATAGRRVTFVLEYDRTKAEIAVELAEPLSKLDHDVAVALLKKALSRVGQAAQSAAASPHAMSWPDRFD